MWYFGLLNNSEKATIEFSGIWRQQKSRSAIVLCSGPIKVIAIVSYKLLFSHTRYILLKRGFIFVFVLSSVKLNVWRKHFCLAFDCGL